MSGMLDKLAENRVPILLAEIGAYLHLIGRFSEKFIYAQAKDATDSEKDFNYEEVCSNPDFFENTGLDSLLKDPTWESLLNDFKNLNNAGELSSDNDKIKSFCEFIEKHTWRRDKPEPKGLCRILADAHGIVSGIDKALAGRGDAGKQKKAYTFRGTAFGYEKDIELTKKLELKKELFQKIKEILNDIKNKQDISYENYSEFVSKIKECYSKTISETRRPINEISLYDYAHTIASLMKSSLVKIVIDGWQDPLTKNFNKRLKWRIIKINVDVVGLMSRGLKIGDILGYKYEIEKMYDNVKKIIEFDYPLGNEIYRDSTGIYFSCPDVNDISELKSEIIDKLKGLNQLDFSLQIEISDRSRSMVILAREIEESSRVISYPHIGNIDNLIKEFKDSQTTRGEDICPVCRLRLKLEQKDRCEKCKDKYEKRAKVWLDDPSRETIWLDEVADKNDRVALIVGQFDLRKWISGEFVGTFISQTFDEWKDVCSDVCNKLNIKNISDLENGFENLFNNPRGLDDNWRKICGSFLGIRPGDFIDDFWNPIAERDATGKALTLKDNSKKTKHLIKLLFRKHPSPARIYRIWKTTHEFIKETIFENILKEYNWNHEVRRQRIQFKIEPNPDIPEGSTCDIDVDGLRFSPVCIDRENGAFVSTINLEILEKFGGSASKISESLNNKTITEDNGRWRKGYRITNARPADEKFQNYLPYVKIYNFPDQFMVLVPAYDALEIANRIYRQYEIQFSKVRDRLPFHLGIIAFHRKTPLYVILDAGRRLIDEFKANTKTKNAKIVSIHETCDCDLGNFVKEIELEVNDENFSEPLRWNVSYSTGDPDVEDLWHPYIRLASSGDPGRELSFDYTGNGNYIVHIKELHKEDEVHIEPSFMTLTYLESAADRFGIGTEMRPLDDIRRISEMWKVICRLAETKNITISKLHQFWREIEKIRNEWEDDAIFEDFLRSAIVNELKIAQDDNMFDYILKAAKDGSLLLCLSWYLKVKKEKPGGG